MNLQIGNVGPMERVKIEIVYLQELSLSYNMFYQLHMLGTISPRCMTEMKMEDIMDGFRN
jgi:hypothetical protein